MAARSSMMGRSMSPFRRTKVLENQIDAFLDKLSESGLLFKRAVQIYLDEGASDGFDEKLQSVNRLESEADELRRSIIAQLYTQTLIPESRGDVLGLLENLDRVLSLYEGALWSFAIERPDIPSEFHTDFAVLCDQAVHAAESIVLASRAFFRNIEAVHDHMHKVMFYEKEADKISSKLKRAIFGSDLPLPRKAHLRNFVNHIDNVADQSEDVADRLAIYTIKRRF